MSETFLNPPEELDVFSCALSGVNLIEASAGTGKTWNICALYLRMLLEQQLSVDQILVVTFTKAATAELHERIRARINQVAYTLQTGLNDDPFITQLLNRLNLDEAQKNQALHHLQSALDQFDQAAIHTIHGFCKQALLEAPFAAGLPFQLGEISDDSALRKQLAQYFWYQHIEPFALKKSSFAYWLVEQKLTPKELEFHLSERLKQPLAQIRWQIQLSNQTIELSLLAMYEKMRQDWRIALIEVNELFQKSETWLNQTTHKQSILQKALQAWNQYFEAGLPFASIDEVAFKLMKTKIIKATRKGQVTPEHDFFEAIEDFVNLHQQLQKQHQADWLSLLKQWLQHAPNQLAVLKKQARIETFDDFLTRFYQALIEHSWLAKIFRQRYHAALIDEFQDTDPLQFEIFQKIFAPNGPLFLVGDPKQAIYHFRGADLHTYLHARNLAQKHYTLSVNQRSTEQMIAALNTLLSKNQSAFILNGLNYVPVRASDRMREAWHDDASNQALNVWLLPETQLLSKKEARSLAVRACAAEIYRLIKGAQAGQVRIGERALMPDQIAILVRKNEQGKQMKEELAQWGIASVELNQESVYLSEDALHFERLLRVLDAPNQLALIRNVLTLDWFALDAKTLRQLNSDHEQFDEYIKSSGWVERFLRYKHIWQQRGFAVMWQTLLFELSIAQHLIVLPQGERRLTNVYHLAELIQARVSRFSGVAATLRWFAAQRHQAQPENTQLHLESDRHLVQIATIHKAKGLEYAVVFCPFMFEGELPDLASAKEWQSVFYHLPNGQQVFDYGANEAVQTQALLEKQQDTAAEAVRLLYVALTRAVYRCYLVAGPYARSSSSAKPTLSKEAKQALLNWLVTDQAIPFHQWLNMPQEAIELAALWKGLNQADISVKNIPLEISRQCFDRSAHQTQHYMALQSNRTLFSDWQLSSFTALMLHQKHHAKWSSLIINDDRASEVLLDTLTLVEDDILISPEAEIADIIDFPKGAIAGECLHYLLEHIVFAEPEQWGDVAEQALQMFPVPGEKAQLKQMMFQLLSNMKDSQLNAALSLLDIRQNQSIYEMPFIFSVEHLSLQRLQRVLNERAQLHFDFQAYSLQGYMKGFVDLVFEAQGKFWIIDWKSNYLGRQPEDYQQSAMQQAMQEHSYYLQALIYSLALHRYLKSTRPDYDYEKHMGGCFYLFIRGMRPKWQALYPFSGVYAYRPSKALIDTLDQLFAGEEDV